MKRRWDKASHPFNLNLTQSLSQSVAVRLQGGCNLLAGLVLVVSQKSYFRENAKCSHKKAPFDLRVFTADRGPMKPESWMEGVR